MTAQLPHARGRRHHRRRHRRLLDRLSPDQARHHRRAAAGAQAAHLRHDLARGRADRAAARDPADDRARQVHLRAAARRWRPRPGRRPASSRTARSAVALNAERFEELKRGASMAQELRPRGRGDRPGRDQGALPAARGRRRRSAACSCPRTGRPTRSTRRRPSPRARASAARGSSKASRSSASWSSRAGRWASMTEQGPVAASTVVLARRHVVARAGGRRRRLGAAARGRAFLHRHRAAGRGAARPAGAAGHRRMHLLQGGRRQAAGRRLRAGGEALGHGRHPGELLLRQPARGHGSFRADPGEGHRTACRSWRRPASRPSSTARRASRRTIAISWARRRSCATCSSPPASTRSASRARAAPARSLARMDPRPPHAGRPDRRRRAPRCTRSRATARYLRDRTTETLGLLYAMHWPYRQYATARGVRRSPFHDRLVARGRGHGRDGGLGAAELVCAAPGSGAPSIATPGAGRTGSSTPAAECRAVRDAVALFDQSSFAKFLVEGRGRLRGPEPHLARRHGRARRAGSSTPNGCNERGGIEADLTVTRLAETELPRRHRRRRPDPRPRLAARAHPRAEARCTVVDITSGLPMLGLMGPRSRELLAAALAARTCPTPPSRSAPRARSRSAMPASGRAGSPMSASWAGSSTSRPNSRPMSSTDRRGRPGVRPDAWPAIMR